MDKEYSKILKSLVKNPEATNLSYYKEFFKHKELRPGIASNPKAVKFENEFNWLFKQGSEVREALLQNPEVKKLDVYKKLCNNANKKANFFIMDLLKKMS